ncbi:DUF11 domain-containing protein [Aquihabitans sp. G128]|uniref:DUF7507 domain-containing protein n=1 Tax=Aquihabitans sp. G128 TaxID=2849779 RepID=UPI001C2506E7|nr:DUF11 domain-containing protein [Aquihabitans sp. G128]QXC59373.1 DUF11 domain-containing protein [Aquihabitans sp. G128]
MLAACTFALATDATAPTVAAAAPGNPGVPSAGIPIYSEDFSNQSASGAPIRIGSYTGGPDAEGLTYSADAAWSPGASACNGWIMAKGTPLPANGGTPAVTDNDECDRNDGFGNLGEMAVDMGTYQGMTPAQAASNQILSAYTNSVGGTQAAGVLLSSNGSIATIPGHYYAVSAIFGAQNCFASQPKLTFELVVDGSPVVLGTDLNPCTDPSSVQMGNVRVAKLQSRAIQMPIGTNSVVGLRLRNTTASGTGNDGAFDLPQIVDITPQLDKSFSPPVIRAGAPSTLTFTVTNTAELEAKTDWAFTDALPADVRVAATPNVGGTCGQLAGSSFAVTAAAGSGQVSAVGGDLGLDQASCTITVDVTSDTAGSYVNGPGNMTSLIGLYPPADTPLRVIDPAIDLVKSASPTTFTAAGQTITYTFTATNTGRDPLADVTITDPLPGLSALTCDPAAPSSLAVGATMTCTATYETTQADVDAGKVVNVATTKGTDLSGGTVTDSDTKTITGTASPAIALDKSASAIVDANGDGIVGNPGDTIDYRFEVTNTGNVTLAHITVDDPKIDVTCPTGALAPGASVTCGPVTYVITRPETAAGQVVNTATATGVPPTGPPATSPPSTVRVPIEEPPTVPTTVPTTVPPTVPTTAPPTGPVTTPPTVPVGAPVPVPVTIEHRHAAPPAPRSSAKPTVRIGSLPVTGASVLGLALAGASLVFGGVVLVGARRRRGAA